MPIRRVAAQGDVSDYCRDHGYYVKEWYNSENDPADYSGEWNILVTDWPYESKNEYYATKIRLLRRGIELISTVWNDMDLDDFAQEFVELERKRRKKNHSGGRCPFGYRWIKGEQERVPGDFEVAQLIVRLRDEGKTYQQIADHPDVHRADGTRFGTSIIQVILRNRSRYES